MSDPIPSTVRAGYYCQECLQDTFPPYPHKHLQSGAWHMPASAGGFYEVLPTQDGRWWCPCASFGYRGRCRHLMGSVSQPGVYALELEANRKKGSHGSTIPGRNAKRIFPGVKHQTKGGDK